jgi:hypothetical protein
MIGRENHGQVMVINADMQCAGSLSSEGPGGAGMFNVNSPNGKPVAALLGTREGGIVFTYDRFGNVIATLPSVPPPPNDDDSEA